VSANPLKAAYRASKQRADNRLGRMIAADLSQFIQVTLNCDRGAIFIHRASV
jgi:hypothetical protein